MDTLIGDSQKASAKILAKQERAFKKKEGRFQLGKSLLSTLAQFVPGGKLISSGIDIIGDPIARSLGAGGDPDKFKLSGKNLAFGGEEAVGTMKEGAQDYLDMAREKSITSGLTSLASYGMNKGLGDKFKDMFGKTSPLPSNTTGLNVGDILETPYSDKNIKISAINNLIGAEGNKPNSWIDMLFRPSEVQRSGGMGYEQGGMVQKYQEGGQVKRTKTSGWGESQETTTVWDTYEYDGINWNKTGTGLETDPGLTNMTLQQMANYRSEERTAGVRSQYMDDPSEHGIQEFLRTPAVASLVEKARGGSAGALENLVEMVRQARPEVDKSNAELRESLKKILPKMDLYGEGYQDVLAGAETTLEGLTGKAQEARGQKATQQATSGIRRPGTEGTISEALYTGAEDVYAGMQRDIQGEYDESFGDFEKMITNV